MMRKKAAHSAGNMNNMNGMKNNRPRKFQPRGNGGNPNMNIEDQVVQRQRRNAPAAREKYLNLAREALSGGDRVLAENYLQHADHYYRLMLEDGLLERQRQQQQQHQQRQQQQQQQQYQQGAEGGESMEGEAVAAPAQQQRHMQHGRPHRHHQQRPVQQQGENPASHGEAPAYPTEGDASGGDSVNPYGAPVRRPQQQEASHSEDGADQSMPHPGAIPAFYNSPRPRMLEQPIPVEPEEE